MIEERDLESFFSSLCQVVKVAQDAQDRVDQKLAESFSVSDVLIRHERQLSDALKFLLNPGESHGQGNRFLQEFLTLLPLRELRYTLDNCKVIPESPVPKNGGYPRRIDLLLELGSLVIGIENKPWFLDDRSASDLDDQIADYCGYLHKRFDNGWFFIYLSGAGLHPPENSICRADWQEYEKLGRARRMAYRPNEAQSEEHCSIPSISGWLQQCIEVCEADVVTQFLRDLHGYVLRIGNDRSVNMSITESETAKFILADLSQIKLANNVADAWEHVQKKLKSTFWAYIAQLVGDQLQDGWIVNSDEPLEKYAALVKVRHQSWPDGAYVGIEDRDNNRNFVGVWSQPNSLPEDVWDSLQNTLCEEFNLNRNDRTRTQYFPAGANLGDIGFAQFAGNIPLELAHKIYRDNVTDNGDVKRLVDWLVALARKSHEILGR